MPLVNNIMERNDKGILCQMEIGVSFITLVCWDTTQKHTKSDRLSIFYTAVL